MYLKGVGIRSIERLEEVLNPLILHWRHFGEIVHKEIRGSAIRQSPNYIAIIEIDELLAYYKKRPNDPVYGLLPLSETENRLLISQSN